MRDESTTAVERLHRLIGELQAEIEEARKRDPTLYSIRFAPEAFAGAERALREHPEDEGEIFESIREAFQKLSRNPYSGKPVAERPLGP